MDPKLLSAIAAAGAAGDSVIGVEDVFKTYLVTGNGSARSINTGIDMTGGGLVWSKNRSMGSSHALIDSERGGTKVLKSDHNGASETESTAISSFNNNGYSVGSYSLFNNTSSPFVQYSFKKQKKFFTIKTYTGSGSTQSLSHDLGSIPGAIFIKCTSGAAHWAVYNRGMNGGTDPEDYGVSLNRTNAQSNDTWFGDTAPTASAFTVGDAHSETNTNGSTYVAYLFAHEEAEFGPNSDQKIISCGSYSGTGSAGLSVTLPFEPQYILVKKTSGTSEWYLQDSMQGIVNGGTGKYLRPSTDEAAYNGSYFEVKSNGFKVVSTDGDVNGSGQSYIYIAIAAETGKTSKVPENGSDVFAMDTGNNSSTIPAFDSGFPVDFALGPRNPAGTGQNYVETRLTGNKELATNLTSAESSGSDYVWDSNVGWAKSYNSNSQSWMWKRSAGFDVQAVTTTGSGYQFLGHSLGVAPEMVFMKKRDGTSDWHVWHKDLNGGTTPYNWSLHLNDNSAEWESGGNMWGLSNNPDATWVIILDSYFGGAGDYLMFLFASVEGVSKCGAYQGSDSDQFISLGFQPRFFLCKCYDVGGTGQSWTVFDSLRGISGASTKRMWLDLNNTQDTGSYVTSVSSTGITLGGGFSHSNGSDRNYIYYAHA